MLDFFTFFEDEIFVDGNNLKNYQPSQKFIILKLHAQLIKII